MKDPDSILEQPSAVSVCLAGSSQEKCSKKIFGWSKVEVMKVQIAENINPANDYTELVARAYKDAGCEVVLGVSNFYSSNYVPDLLHIQWPEALYIWRHRLPNTKGGLSILTDRVDWYRSQGTLIVHTVHNLAPHNSPDPDFDRSVFEYILSNVDFFVHHGTRSIEIVRENYPNIKFNNELVCPHGPYDVHLHDRTNMCMRYGLPRGSFIILNFGRQRLNKGFFFVKNVFSAFDDQDYCFFTIGPNHTGKRDSPGLARRGVRKLRRMSARLFPGAEHPVRAVTIEREFPPDEIPLILSACDMVFLGHTSGLNSGVLALAASYSKPFVYPDIGNFKEQAEGAFCEPYEVENVDSAVEAVHRLRRRMSDCDAAEFANAWRQRNSWEIHVRTILDAARNARK